MIIALRILVLWCSLLMPLAVAAASLEPQDTQATRLLEAAKPALVHLKVVSTANAVEAASGSGFAIGEPGWMATNYHVVSDVVLKPEIYRLHFSTPDGQKGIAQVIAIDVANDLAIVRTHLVPPNPFKLATGTPTRGEEVYALGFPNRQPVTITQGLYNGPVAQRYAARYHFTGPLNGGMSGGPALNRRGEVLGVNVESRRSAQLVSYLVPAQALSKLIDATRQQSTQSPDAKTVEQQVRAYSEKLISTLLSQLGNPTRIGNYRVPGENALLKCSGSTKLDDTGEYETSSQFCTPNSDIYLSSDTADGVEIELFAMRQRNIKMDPYRFAQAALPNIQSKPGSPRVDTGPSTCRYKTLGLQGMRVRAEICVQHYRPFDLADYTLKLATIDRSDERLSVMLRAYSLPDAAAKLLIKAVLESISWQKDTSPNS